MFCVYCIFSISISLSPFILIHLACILELILKYEIDIELSFLPYNLYFQLTLTMVILLLKASFLFEITFNNCHYSLTLLHLLSLLLSSICTHLNCTYFFFIYFNFIIILYRSPRPFLLFFLEITFCHLSLFLHVPNLVMIMVLVSSRVATLYSNVLVLLL